MAQVIGSKLRSSIIDHSVVVAPGHRKGVSITGSLVHQHEGEVTWQRDYWKAELR